jgi:hypothetical protein
MKYNIGDYIIVGRNYRKAVVIGDGVGNNTTKIKYIDNKGKIKNVWNSQIRYKIDEDKLCHYN